jgi:hypothetical protein
MASGVIELFHVFAKGHISHFAAAYEKITYVRQRYYKYLGEIAMFQVDII